ncbi:hypothetical protein [Anaerobiospirillum sp. NML120511]|uniref:hypothetical protein n=1 Tax=Anaerobiospirillum sp. NML120511 TaxID=2932819 RepID=UPI001FF54CA2|nr:hypothetical protein [Anaerobiospirillum sp. NML120511]MCK0535760.1 hypothetical protein [Anaerobiospirillum sp. NML120511]
MGRHIHALKEQELINIELRDGKRWISVNANTSSSFIPFIFLDNNTMTYSEALFLSGLLNTSCTFARAGVDFVLPNNSVRAHCENLISQKVFSQGKIHRIIDSLEHKGLILPAGAAGGGVAISPDITQPYARLLKVRESQKASDILNTRAVAEVVKYVDTPLTRIMRAQKLDAIPGYIHNPVDVIDTIEGITFIDKDDLNQDIPFYEESLAQSNTLLNNEHFTPACGGAEYNASRKLSEVKRNEFYSMSQEQQWQVTLTDAFNSTELACESSTAFKLSSNQLRTILIDGIAGQDDRDNLESRLKTAVRASHNNNLQKVRALQSSSPNTMREMVNAIKIYEHRYGDRELAAVIKELQALTDPGNTNAHTPSSNAHTSAHTSGQGADSILSNAHTNFSNAHTLSPNAHTLAPNAHTYKNGIKNDCKNAYTNDTKNELSNDAVPGAGGADHSAAPVSGLRQALSELQELDSIQTSPQETPLFGVDEAFIWADNCQAALNNRPDEVTVSNDYLGEVNGYVISFGEYIARRMTLITRHEKIQAEMDSLEHTPATYARDRGIELIKEIQVLRDLCPEVGPWQAPFDIPGYGRGTAITVQEYKDTVLTSPKTFCTSESVTAGGERSVNLQQANEHAIANDTTESMVNPLPANQSSVTVADTETEAVEQPSINKVNSLLSKLDGFYQAALEHEQGYRDDHETCTDMHAEEDDVGHGRVTSPDECESMTGMDFVSIMTGLQASSHNNSKD